MTHNTTPAAIQNNNTFKQGDVFVLFGELFGRGYATGLIDAAKKEGMEIIGITVGRRDENNQLRALTQEEKSEAEANLGGRIINVPLMAGFDLDAAEGEATPTDLLNEMTKDSWREHKLDWAHIERCREVGVDRFRRSAEQAMAELDQMIPSGANVFFAHTMAGGIPRAKVFMVIANQVYKGRGARHMPSQALIDSDLGKFLLQNFDEVTANTFEHLIEASSTIRERIESAGGSVSYTAYGYHGTRILIDAEYRWQTYTSYTQGYAKMRLEQIAETAWSKGIKATVFNCPEIRTNSSDVFAGIELSLIPLLSALKTEEGGEFAQEIWDECGSLLKDDASLEDVLGRIESYMGHLTMEPFYNFAGWPMQNSPDQVELTVGTSQDIVALHKDRKALISDVLSQHVVSATGRLIFSEAGKPTGPVQWLDHDVVARDMIRAAKS